jgi:hypothetical protein
MLRWLPSGLTLQTSALLNYGWIVMREAGALTRPAFESALNFEALTGAFVPTSFMARLPYESPASMWGDSAGGRPMLVVLDDDVEHLTRDLLLQGLTRERPLSLLRRKPAEEWLEDPGRTSKLGFWLGVKAARQWGMQSPEFSRCVALIALGSLGMQLQRRCEICFRQALPSTSRCGKHSQSKIAVKDAEPSNHLRTMNARIARRVLEQLGALGPTANLEAARQDRTSMLVGAIFDRPHGPLDSWIESMEEALAAAPGVCHRLPLEFNLRAPSRALPQLREALDPLERNACGWPAKIAAAEPWLQLERAIAPGKPPSGPRRGTLERLVQAAELQAQGVSEEEIAARLKTTVRALRVSRARHAKAP